MNGSYKVRIMNIKITDDDPRAIRTHISARTHKGLESVALADVLFFRAEHKYVTVHHTQGEMLIDESLKSLEQEFGDLLVRIHRSILVKRTAIQGLERNDNNQHLLVLKDSCQRLPISRRHASQVRALVQSL